MSRLFAMIHDDIVVALENAITNPFHRAVRAVDVTGQQVRIGDEVDAHGNIGPSPVMTLGQAGQRNRTILRGIAQSKAFMGVKVDDAVIDTHHENLALLLTLAAGNADQVPDVDGNLVKVPAERALHAVAGYLAAVFDREGELAAEIEKDANADLTQGWPDNGEKVDAAPAPVSTNPGIAHAPAVNLASSTGPVTALEAPPVEDQVKPTLVDGTVPNNEVAAESQAAARADAEAKEDAGKEHDDGGKHQGE